MATADPDSVSRTGNAYVDSLLWGDRWDQSSGPITYEFWRVAGSYAWAGVEKVAFRSAMASWSSVAEVEFQDDAGNPTDLNFLLSDLGNGVYAYQLGPNGDQDDGIGEYDRKTFDDWAGQLRPGGFAFATILHELGHALGLAHPHDRGGDSTIFPGVTPDASRDTGSYGLNTALYTVMSYNDVGEWWAPDSEAPFGFAAGPMAFDIAAIQHIYGANMATGAGDDAYALPRVDRTGTGYLCIWDAGGTDRIVYSGSLDVTIDLRPAPLTGSHAGGYLSRVDGVRGGFTIANGVAIERAHAGSGDDVLTGNDAANLLFGGRGKDVLAGGRGDDVLVGGAGADRFDGGAGIDLVGYQSAPGSIVVDLQRGIGSRGDASGDRFGSIEGLAGSGHNDTVTGSGAHDRIAGGDGNDIVKGGNGSDTLSGGAGLDRLHGERGDDRLTGSDGPDRLYGGDGNDRLYGGSDADLLYGGNGADRLYAGTDAGRLSGGAGDDFAYGGAAADRILGDEGDDRLYGSGNGDLLWGGDGNDLLFGGDGDDRLYGGDGNDRLEAGSGHDLLLGGPGIDTALLSGDRADYAIDRSVSARVVLLDGEAMTTLVDIEYIRFADILVRNTATAGDALMV